MAMHLTNPLACLHVCLHSERASRELDLALDKQSAGAEVQGAWQLKRGGGGGVITYKSMQIA